MDQFVFDVPIAAHHPYEQNVSDYDEYFLRDLDAIFEQTPLLGSDLGYAAEPHAKAADEARLQHQQQQQVICAVRISVKSRSVVTRQILRHRQTDDRRHAAGSEQRIIDAPRWRY